ncbi:cytoskeleton-associated protein 5 [Caerostris extrusa]|uniref:Cytoskeleton-associated protein 5 n=1 Tax=Caerostris extrusa TaxID=172846 RepID=A0AAV4UTR7_CAEEX|nr:cytoskeleton-associated protein 5 [Caerostris extrusa]
MPEPTHAPAKPNSAEIKKPGSATTVKTKGSVPARSVRSGGVKKAPVDAGEPEFKEQDLSEEDVLEKASEILTDDVINGLGSSNWKDRLVAILKLRFEILCYIADNAQISHIAVESCLSDVVDKIGDSKNGVHAGLALTSLASATKLDYISLEVLNLAFNQRNPKNQSEALIWVSNAIKQFGLKVQVKEIIDNLKKGFSSTNPGVRNAALALVGTMYMYVGKSLRSFFEDEKPALLQQIDSEFEKMKDIKPPVPMKGIAAKAIKSRCC